MEAALVAGESHSSIAKRHGVTRQAVTQFAKTRADAIGAVEAKVVEAVIEQAVTVAVADKQWRIENAARALQKVNEWIETYGLVTVVEHHGEHDSYTENRFTRAPVDALIALQRYVGDELGQIPKAGINFNLGDTNNTLQLDLEGFTKEDVQKLFLMAAEKAGRA